MKAEKGDVHIVDIQQVSPKGDGQTVVREWSKRGNVKKLKLTIPQTIPGECVRAVIKQPGRRRSIAIAEELIKPSSERVQPRCPHFVKCGGCAWQHWNYADQLKQKTTYVRNMLEERGFNPLLVRDVIGMEDPWHYRNKMDFTFASDGSLGLHEQGNFLSIIPLETCFIAGGDIAEVAIEVADWAKENKLKGYEKKSHTGLLRNLIVRYSFATNEMMLGLFATEAPGDNLEIPIDNLVERIKHKFPQVASLLWLVNTDLADIVQAQETHVLAGRDFIYDELAGYTYRLWVDTFFQTNPTQAKKLVEIALEMAQPKNTEKMVDLFCGVGTFSLPFASKTSQLAGIEIVEKSIESAKRNASENGISNTIFLAESVRLGMDQVLEQIGRPALVLLDPPRPGAGGKVMRKIARTQVKRIVYISCNPESFATDIMHLKPFGYELKAVQPVDMFPHTAHVESVALLEKAY